MAAVATDRREVLAELLERCGVKNISKLSEDRMEKKVLNRIKEGKLPDDLSEDEQDIVTELSGRTAEEASDDAASESPKKGKKAKKMKKAKEPKEPKERKLSLIGAAAQVLKRSKKPMNCSQMVESAAEQGLWESPAGKTPHATLYSAILREMNENGKESRFKKVDRGQFEYVGE